MGVVVTLKSKMTSTHAWTYLEIQDQFYLSYLKANKSPEPLVDGQATSEHMTALLSFKFPASGKYDGILNVFVTTTPTVRVRAVKALFDVIMHKVYCVLLIVGFEHHKGHVVLKSGIQASRVSNFRCVRNALSDSF